MLPYTVSPRELTFAAGGLALCVVPLSPGEGGTEVRNAAEMHPPFAQTPPWLYKNGDNCLVSVPIASNVTKQDRVG